MPGSSLRIPAIIILIVIPIAYAGLSIFGNDVIFLQTGEAIEAEESWIVGNTVFYIAGGQVEIMSGRRVERIVPGGYGVMNVPALLSYHFIHKKKNALNLLAWMLMATVIWGLFLFGTGRKRLAARKPSPLAAPEPPASGFPPEDRLKFDFGIDIVKFFLAIYKYQLGASASASTRITSTEKDQSGNQYTYKLHVKHDGTWHARRMTISPIGEESSSRSKCYYVIYDSHLVIKVPPKPVVDFNNYIENIHREKRIAEKIAPRECLIPRIATILSRIHKFADESDLSADQLEQRYITLVDTRPEFKKFLKIDDTHVYFMDLAKYYFLGPIIKTMHDNETEVRREITGNPHLLWDAREFDGRYGTDAQPVHHDFLSLYTEFRKRLRALQEKHQADNDLIKYRRREWFLNALAGEPISNIEKNFPKAFSIELAELCNTLLTENQEIVGTYKNLVRDYVARLSLIRNQPMMSAMITNLLDLLTWLGEKGIAIRDLKPDNLLAAGDQNKFPIFLSTAREYNIGLIDLETAVDFKPAPFSQMEQPLIGGTLYYATPTHFLVNRSLQKHFPEPGRIYFLQDWHAALAIFYELVVGDYLFKRSARLLHNTMRTIRQTNGAAGMNARHHFWHSASEELHAKCQEHAAALNTVKAVIPEEFQEWLARELSVTVETLDRCIAGHVRAQSYFKPEKTNEFLEFSIPKIEKLRNNCQNGRLFPDLPEKRRHKLIKFFNELIAHRNAQSHAAGYLRVLRNESRSIAALDLIQMMFLVVRYGMHAE